MTSPDSAPKTPEHEDEETGFGATARTRSEGVLGRFGKMVREAGGERRRVYSWTPKRGVGTGWTMTLSRLEGPMQEPATEYQLDIVDPEYRPGCGVLKFSEAVGIDMDSTFPHRGPFTATMTVTDWQNELLSLLGSAFAPEEPERNN